eukprot:15120976-Alexandrium_andersonii.AAC.1
MSASLVGSEMCIRDSCSLPRPADGPPRPGRGGDKSPKGGGRGWSGNARAVSYTHLTLPTICSV